MLSIRRSAIAACVITGVLTPAVAGARDVDQRPWTSVSDGGSMAAAQLTGQSSFSAQEDPPSDPGGLPAAAENIELVSELNPTGPSTPEFASSGVRIGEIADLAVHKGYAYLNSWDNADCTRGGVYVVDIRDVRAPKEIAYIPPQAGQAFYHGEGAHAISVDTPAFRGDMLAVNNETFGSNIPENTCGPASTQGGGFDLYDVSNPAEPKILVQGAGDRDGGDADPATNTPLANSYHSVFVWQAGPRAYLVASDNIELEDVDIFDITDPKNPEFIGDLDLVELTEGKILEGEQANGGSVFNHDMIVEEIDGRQIMKVDYWDAGYVQIDVTDPRNPTYVRDTTFTGSDPQRPGAGISREGNAHYGEFSFDDQFLLAADEDFATFRTNVRSTSGATSGRSATATEGDSNARIAELPDGKLNGPSTFVGNACAGNPVPAAPADDGDPNTDRIALIERGVCSFAEKFANAEAAGYDGVVIYNNARPDDGTVNMLTGPADIPGVHMRRVDALGPNGVLSTSTTTPAPGTAGPNLDIGQVFDGWGYAHLYDAKTNEEIDTYTVPEANDPRYAEGFGDLSIHEFATDPTEPVAYAAWYAAGLRTFRFSRADGLVPTGKWIDDDGNGSNFWGVEVFTGSDGERYIAASDRDFGLQIFRYTGPARAQRPVCEESTATATAGSSTSIELSCTDANGNPLAIRITDPPDNGTLSGVTTARASAPVGRITYTPNPGFTGTDSFAYVASDGAAESAEKRVTVTVSQTAATPTPTPGPYYYGIKRTPRLTAFAKPKRDRKKPFIFRVQGALKLPQGVTKAAGCKGTVRITARKVKKGKATTVLAKRRTGVKSTCKYKARVKLRKNKAGRRGKVRFKVEFLGNDRLNKASKSTKAKYGTPKRKKNRK